MEADAFDHYRLGQEEARLTRRAGLLEKLRTLALLERFLPPAPARVLDVGGGTGPYAFALAERGHVVRLIDLVPEHVDRARELIAQADGPAPESADVGDARALDRPDGSADAVLLLGPLYHLTGRADRLAALGEARRVLRPGGVLLAAAISRFASSLDGLHRGLLDDPLFQAIVERDLTDGQHRNPERHPAYFATAYFHHPDELGAELIDAGLEHQATLAVEGPAWLAPDVDGLVDDPDRRDRWLALLERLEAEPSLLGVSAHLMGVGRRPVD